jgi:hypothetical protein
LDGKRKSSTLTGLVAFALECRKNPWPTKLPYDEVITPQISMNIVFGRTPFGRSCSSARDDEPREKRKNQQQEARERGIIEVMRIIVYVD